jgi:hypothetical protein
MNYWVIKFVVLLSMQAWAIDSNTVVSDDAIRALKAVADVTDPAKLAEFPTKLNCQAQDKSIYNVFITDVRSLKPTDRTWDIDGRYSVSVVDPDSFILEFGDETKRDGLKFSHKEMSELARGQIKYLNSILVRGARDPNGDHYEYQIVNCKCPQIFTDKGFVPGCT